MPLAIQQLQALNSTSTVDGMTAQNLQFSNLTPYSKTLKKKAEFDAIILAHCNTRSPQGGQPKEGI